MIELKVTGMNCQHCAQGVEDALKGVAGETRAVSVELDSGRALVASEADPQALVAAVEAAGYRATIVSS